MIYHLKHQNDCTFYLCRQKISGVSYRKGERERIKCNSFSTSFKLQKEQIDQILERKKKAQNGVKSFSINVWFFLLVLPMTLELWAA